MRRRRRESHGWRVLLLSGRVTGSREGGGYPIPVGRLRLRPRNWMALATTNGQACASGRRVELKGGTRRRMDMPFRWVRFELSLGSVWTRRARFPGARALGGSSTWRLGGLSGRQLTGPVAEAPEVDLRSSAASRHQAELGVWCPGGAEANHGFSLKQSSRKKSYYEKTVP